MNTLWKDFETLLPLAIEWATAQELMILENGEPLSSLGLLDAQKMGVNDPEKIRLLRVDSVPMPEHPLLRQAAETMSFISPNTAGMAIRYGIFVRSDYWNHRSLIAHECVHTGQYERFGSIAAFLTQYLRECLEIGYPDAPLEQEAILRCRQI